MKNETHIINLNKSLNYFLVKYYNKFKLILVYIIYNMLQNDNSNKIK